MFSIETQTVRLELEIVRVETLFLHERILPRVMERLVLEFGNWANLENPVIIDKNNIVLDGNHRTFVFKRLGFKYIPVCRIDYFENDTKLRYWFRMVGGLRSLADLKSAVEELGGSLRPLEDMEALGKALQENRFCCGIQHDRQFVLVTFCGDAVCDSVSAYATLEKLQERLVAKGMKVDYIPCQYVADEQFCQGLGEEKAVIWTPQITKEMVVEAARKEQVFAPKSTRHLIPARPIHVNVPTRWLKEEVSLEEINARFLKLLESKDVKRIGPGQVVNGRYYEEEIFVFVDKVR